MFFFFNWLTIINAEFLIDYERCNSYLFPVTNLKTPDEPTGNVSVFIKASFTPADDLDQVRSISGTWLLQIVWTPTKAVTNTQCFCSLVIFFVKTILMLWSSVRFKEADVLKCLYEECLRWTFCMITDLPEWGCSAPFPHCCWRSAWCSLINDSVWPSACDCSARGSFVSPGWGSQWCWPPAALPGRQMWWWQVDWSVPRQKGPGRVRGLRFHCSEHLSWGFLAGLWHREERSSCIDWQLQ